MSLIFNFYKAVLTRETRKILLQKDRLLASLVRPLLWLWVIGGGMQALAGADYSARLLPGILAMTVLFGGMIGGLSIAFDKDAGTMRLLVTSPVHTIHALISKTLAAAIGALMQLLLLLTVLGLLELLFLLGQALQLDLQQALPWVGKLSLPSSPGLLLAVVLSCLCCAAVGVLCGAMAKSVDGFALMMNFVIFPMFFFSGALYPIEPMPTLAKWIALLNPFSYCVDLFRHALGSHAEFSISLDCAVLLAASIACTMLATWRFQRSGATVSIQNH